MTAVRQEQSVQSKPLNVLLVLPSVPALASLGDKLQAVRWNKPFPSQIAFGHNVLT